MVVENKVKVNILNGFLGVGKTTTIQYLLSNKPRLERWAIIVNEVGEIGIDQALIKTESGVEISEIPGGCICCSLSASLQVVLSELLKNQKLDRILIEPSGIGHPAGVIDILNKLYKSRVDIQAIVTIVNPKHLFSEKHMGHPTYIDQVELADVLVANKTDLCNVEEIQGFYDWAEDFFPPKQQILEMLNGELKSDVLDLKRESTRVAKYPGAHQFEHLFGDTHTHNLQNLDIEPAGIEPTYYTEKKLGVFISGLLFNADCVFMYNELTDLISSIQGVLRIKGVFRTNKGWYNYNKTGDENTAFFPSGYRKDTRVELISDLEDLNLSQFSEKMKSLML